ncbi:LacI family DNA-binding transcriptional regulator [Streptomyces sp. 3MP-14]|uniref:LacI family DNA-binding transcriptional regulator n=1 Tax=Streptomyces mimosae TaxID=2586635 RepID=A0A5N6ADX8_9ACTN|nr:MULTISPECIES: LacI family DNA-binding transcriptional regulator [Streptomyces]KAB8165708.1 LacI family DNA-binding transcriptional regulator [Streptomyces mimosae]KAB8176097.1 LacI family DNA-binding transcriptional regulator [Streptomyces sp. 3MP-14]
MATGGRPGGEPGKRRPTSKDVAAAAGVSRSAVSFAFNDPARISEATRERILAAARELGYVPNAVARMLQAGQTKSLGVLLPQNVAKVMENPYYARFLLGVGQVCDREGFTLLLTPPLRDSMLKAIPYAAVDGFVVCGLETDRGEVEELRRRGIPFVLVDSDAAEGAPSVDVDDRNGAREAVEHLLQLGHRRIAVLSIDPGPTVATVGYRGSLSRRMAGIAEGLSGAGMTMNDVELLEVPCTRAEGYRATGAVMAGRAPTAILALSDVLAIGAVDALHELGLRVPGDVSVTGFDDLPEASWLRPRLTTVHQPIAAKGRLAAELLVSAVRGEDQHPHQVLGTALMVRDSSGRAPAPGGTGTRTRR